MRARALAALALAAAALAATATPAGAHPLGNFSTNHLTVVRVGADRIDVRYVLDLAEIPTFRERDVPAAERLARLRARVLAGVDVTAGGRPVALRPRGPGRLGLRPGQAGLHTTRAELVLSGPATARGAVVVRDETYPGTVGWRAVVVRPGRGTAVRSDVPSADPTRGLRVYPSDVLNAPADRRVARLSVAAGHGTVAAPDGEAECPVATRARRPTACPAPSPTPPRGAACSSSCCWPPSAGARCTRSRPGTGRPWSPPTWSARAGRRATRWRWAGSSR